MYCLHHPNMLLYTRVVKFSTNILSIVCRNYHQINDVFFKLKIFLFPQKTNRLVQMDNMLPIDKGPACVITYGELFLFTYYHLHLLWFFSWNTKFIDVLCDSHAAKWAACTSILAFVISIFSIHFIDCRDHFEECFPFDVINIANKKLITQPYLS